MEKYISPFTDFGFKKIFGEEANKDLLIDFLNQLIQDQGQIVDLVYLKNEHLGITPADRKVIFDLYCENERGEKFIVELQKAYQKFFKDRSLYYSTFAIQEQAKTGDWDFKLQRVYTIAIMDFVFDESRDNQDQLIHNIGLLDIKTKKVFNDKIRYIYLEMPKFRKTEEELETHFDKWLYVLRNLARLQSVPTAVQERVFQKVFSVAEIAKYSTTDRQAYQSSLKHYRDLKNVMDTAFETGLEAGKEVGLELGLQQGLEKGLEQGRFAEKIGIARVMKQAGEAIEKIQFFTGLTLEQITQA